MRLLLRIAVRPVCWRARLCQVVHGDKTWVKLFPEHFARYTLVEDLYVADVVEVDSNVTRELGAANAANITRSTRRNSVCLYSEVTLYRGVCACKLKKHHAGASLPGYYAGLGRTSSQRILER